MKKVLSALFSVLFLVSFVAVLFVPITVSAVSCINSCDAVTVNCDCGGNTVTADAPKYCLNGTRYNYNSEGKAACVAAQARGTSGTQGFREAPEIITTPGELLGLITRIGNWIFSILLGIAGIMLILAGFFWVTAGGDPTKVKTANDTLRYALIGVAVALGARGLVLVIESIIRG